MTSPKILVLKDSDLSSKNTLQGIKLFINSPGSPIINSVLLTDMVSAPHLISTLVSPDRSPIKSFYNMCINHMLDLHYPSIEQIVVFAKENHSIKDFTYLKNDFRKCGPNGPMIIPVEIIFCLEHNSLYFRDEDRVKLGECDQIKPEHRLDMFCSDSRIWQTFLNSMTSSHYLGVGQGYTICLPGGVISLLKAAFKEQIFNSFAKFAQEAGVSKCIFSQHGPDCGF